MRFYLFGPRFLGIRPGISFHPSDFRSRQSTESAASYVYVIKGDNLNGVKIGVTKNPNGRLAQLRTGSSGKIDYAFIAPASGDPYAIEREAHAILHRYRLNGEWFDVPPELAIAAVTGAAAKLGQSLTNQKPNEKPTHLWPVGVVFLIFIAAMMYAISNGITWLFWTIGGIEYFGLLFIVQHNKKSRKL